MSIRRHHLPLILALLLPAPVAAHAQEGQLDPTFNGDGVLHFGSPDHAEVVKVLSAPDGWLTVLGRSFFSSGAGGNDFWKRIGDNGFTAHCYVAGGALDHVFVADGMFDHAGRLVLVGMHADTDQIVVARYLYPSCTLDASFDGDGIKTIASSFWDGERGVGIVERRSGLFPVLTYAYFVLADNGGTILTPRGALLLKLSTTDGALDTSWGGGDGWVSHDFAPDVVTPVSLAIDGAGRLLAALAVEDGGPTAHDFGVARLRGSDGARDASFSGDGFARIPIDANGAASDDVPYAMAVATDNRVALVGSAPSSSGVRRPAMVVLTDSGALDASFAGDGKRLLPAFRSARAVTFLDNGKLILAGEGIDLSFRQESFVARLLASGGNDTSYGAGGYAEVPAIDYGGQDDVATSVVLVNGKTVAAGWGARGGNESDAYLMRFTGLSLPPPVQLLIFRNDFESGDAEAWSGTSP